MKKRDFNNKILQINCGKNGQQHSGSCFILKTNDKLFLVTASHVAKEMNIESYIFINDPITRHPCRINIKDLNPLNNWLFHPYSDVAIMTVNNLTISRKENDENEKSLLIEELAFEVDVDKYATNEEVNINDILFMYGCPEVILDFPMIPFIVECKIVVETWKKLHNGIYFECFLLDHPSAQGFSGGPVLKFDDDTFNIVGIIHGNHVDNTGGKFAIIIPIKYIIELIKILQ